MNFEGDSIPNYKETVKALWVLSFTRYSAKLELDLKNQVSPPIRPSIKELPVLELKVLPAHPRYVFLETNNTLPVIVAANLNEKQVKALITVLKQFKKAIE